MIYYFHDETLPLLALDIYAKSEKTDIGPGDKKHLRAEVQECVRNFTGGK